MRVFVYGTLMAGYRNHERFAAPYLLKVEPARTRGILYDLPAGYPGVAEGDGEVRGQLLTLRDEALPSLDELEACDPAAPADENEYYRREVPVHLENGGTLSAWIYFMRPERVAAMNGVRIESGRWHQHDS